MQEIANREKNPRFVGKKTKPKQNIPLFPTIHLGCIWKILSEEHNKNQKMKISKHSNNDNFIKK
jgi:hypothetical protein